MRRKTAASGGPPGFAKARLLRSRELRPHRDLLQAVLREDREYTVDEAKSLIQGFLIRKVE